MPGKPNTVVAPAELRRRAEVRLRDQRKRQGSKVGDQRSETDTVRVLHELQVHQVELEMQNAELQKTRDELEAALEKYTDLYDFAPVGYFSLDESGVILEANLTCATLLGVVRSRLINRRWLVFVSPTSQPIFLAFLKKAFTGSKALACEALLLKEGGGTFWASFQATSAVRPEGTRKWFRVAFGDITATKQAGEAQRRLEFLTAANQGLKREIARRQTVEQALQKSERHQGRLLKQSHIMHEQLQHLSRQVLRAQEDERRRISRELHDVIAQTLTGINVRLGTLKKEGALNPGSLARNITRTQRLVEQSVKIVHRFARELRPTVLDDLGLIPALHTFMKSFKQETGIHVSLWSFAEVERANGDIRIVLYRVIQEALNNVAHHAQASRAEVRIEKIDGALCVKIKDDGKGFKTERVLHAKKFKRLGLLGMRERLEMVEGRFAIESIPGKGTTIRAQIPLKAAVRGGGGADTRLYNEK